MSFYRIGYTDVMALPVRTFWMMNGNIERICAERDLRQLQLMLGTQSQDNLSDVQSRLLEEMGQPIKANVMAVKRDEEGVELLKRMAMGLA